MRAARIASLLALTLAACSGPAPSGDPAAALEPLHGRGVESLPRIDPGTPYREARVTLEAVPHPDPGRFDEDAVRRQIAERREAVERLLAAETATAGALAAAFGRLGMLYHAYSLVEPAEASYRNAQRLAPREFRWSYYLARLLQYNGRLDEASASFEQAVLLRPDYVPALFWMAEGWRERNRPDLARPLFEVALAHDPSCAAALVGLGRLDLAAGDADAAVERFRAALARQPDAASIHYALGMAHRERGDLEQARGHLARSAPGRVTPPDAEMVEVLALATGRGTAHLRGSRAMTLGRYEFAAREFRNMVAAQPDDPGARVNLALALEGLGDLEGARDQLEQAVRIDPRHLQAQLNLARCHVERGDAASAARAFRAAMEIDPGHLGAKRGLADVLGRAGRHAEAVALLEAVIEADPADGEAYVRLAAERCIAGRYAEALGGLERAHAQMPRDNRIVVALARLLAAAPRDALRDGARALELLRSPQGSSDLGFEYLVALAMTHAELGDFGQAVRRQEQALELARRSTADRLPVLERRLDQYRRGEPCREPCPRP